MYKKLHLTTLIEQEKRAAKTFLFLLMTVVLFVDIMLTFFFEEGETSLLLLGYASILLMLPFIYYSFKNNTPRNVKYIIFITYTVVNLVVEIVIYWDTQNYDGGKIAEVFFILFSPIFINRRFFVVVILSTFCKYVFMGILLETTKPIIPIVILIVLALVVLIILNRFFGYIKAMNNSFYRTFESVVKGIISTLELKDPYTKGHSQRVAEYSVILAKSLNIYCEDDLKMIYQACLLHDIGKVHTPDHILSKPGKLTQEEYEIVKQHPVVGAQAIKDIQGYELCLDIVLYHHERWDGKGYPEGLRETQIPITARITAIADSFDAMTTKRSYRDAMSSEDAYQQLILGKGTQFDPALIEYFETIFSEWEVVLQNWQKK